MRSNTPSASSTSATSRDHCPISSSVRARSTTMPRRSAAARLARQRAWAERASPESQANGPRKRPVAANQAAAGRAHRSAFAQAPRAARKARGRGGGGGAERGERAAPVLPQRSEGGGGGTQPAGEIDGGKREVEQNFAPPVEDPVEEATRAAPSANVPNAVEGCRRPL